VGKRSFPGNGNEKAKGFVFKSVHFKWKTSIIIFEVYLFYIFLSFFLNFKTWCKKLVKKVDVKKTKNVSAKKIALGVRLFSGGQTPDFPIFKHFSRHPKPEIGSELLILPYLFWSVSLNFCHFHRFFLLEPLFFTVFLS